MVCEGSWIYNRSTKSHFCVSILYLVIFILDGSPDIIDETLQYFKANVFFKNYEIKVYVYFDIYFHFRKRILHNL